MIYKGLKFEKCFRVYIFGNKKSQTWNSKENVEQCLTYVKEIVITSTFGVSFMYLAIYSHMVVFWSDYIA